MQSKSASSGREIKVAVVDSNRIATQLLASALQRSGCSVVYEGTSAEHASSGIALHHPEVALISASLDGEPHSGYELAAQWRSLHPNLGIVILVDKSDRDSVVRAFRAGARGVFGRNGSVESLSKCVERVCDGQVWASAEELRLILEALVAPPQMRLVNARGLDLLAPREQEVVHCVAEGLSNREIAERLHLSENTVKNYMFRIFDKLGISKRVELVLYAASQYAPATAAALADNPAAVFDDEKATFRWCREAAERFGSNPCALAEMYRDGRGVSADPSAALMWFLVAEQVALRLVPEARDAAVEVEGQMTQEQVANARARAADWLREHNAGTAAQRPTMLKRAG